jgi:hypothetical protein
MCSFGSSSSSSVSSCSSRSSTSAAPAARPRQLRLLRWAAIFSLPAVGIWIGWRTGHSTPYSAHDPPGPTIQQIRQLSQLVTAKITIADARETTLSGYLGDVKAVLVVRGDALLGPDLSQARIISCDPATRTMVIELPLPRVISYRLDHTGTRLACLSHDGLWVIVPGDAGRTAVLNRAYAEAEQAVAEAAAKPDVIDKAIEHAQEALGSFFATGGWRVEIRWTQ